MVFALPLATLIYILSNASKMYQKEIASEGNNYAGNFFNMVLEEKNCYSKKCDNLRPLPAVELINFFEQLVK